MKHLLLSVLFLIHITCSAQDTIIGVIKSVHDGDTFTFLSDKGETYKLRLRGIDCPELKQELGVNAREYAKQYVGKGVAVLYKTDKYKRHIADVFSGGIWINRELVRKGLAIAYMNKDVEIIKAESEAKEHSRGVWGLSNFITPADYRHKKK